MAEREVVGRHSKDGLTVRAVGVHTRVQALEVIESDAVLLLNAEAGLAGCDYVVVEACSCCACSNVSIWLATHVM